MSSSPAKKRAPRVAAPGAQRITFTGIMAVPDDYGRLRIALTETHLNGKPDSSWVNLVRAVPGQGLEYSTPYEIHPTSGDGTKGIALVVVPARHRKHWEAVAESLRGKEVKVEATVRPFQFSVGDARKSGASLDLAMLEPLTDNI